MAQGETFNSPEVNYDFSKEGTTYDDNTVFIRYEAMKKNYWRSEVIAHLKKNKVEVITLLSFRNG